MFIKVEVINLKRAMIQLTVHRKLDFLPSGEPHGGNGV